jgi:hypothetical protein
MDYSNGSAHRGSKGLAATLRALRVRSRRRRMWFRVLTQLERAQVDLTLRMVHRIRSPLLAQVLEAIISKLQSALESRIVRLVRSVGAPLARKLGEIAQSWGYRAAAAWRHDVRFARFLAVMRMNSSSAVSR